MEFKQQEIHLTTILERQNMRNGGIPSAGQNFDFNAGTIKRKPEEDDPIRKAVASGVNFANKIGNLLAAGIMNPQASDNNSGSSTAYRQ